MPTRFARLQPVLMLLLSATANDVEALVDVQQEGAIRGLSHIFPQDEFPFPRAAVVARWHEEIADAGTHAYICLDSAGNISGFAATRRVEVLHFGTSVRTWGSGLAQVLHDAVLSELAVTAPAEATSVCLRVFEDNQRARRFYQRLGWAETSNRTRTAFPPHPTLIELRRALSR